jgi:hypothetical protein
MLLFVIITVIFGGLEKADFSDKLFPNSVCG